MSDRALALSALSVSRTAAAGGWVLAAGHAITLRPQVAGMLHITQGRIWVTENGPHPAQPDRCGDVFVQAGASLALRAGQCVVVESYAAPGSAAEARLHWTDAPRRLSWPARIAEPAAELRLALAHVGQALGQVAAALGRLTGGLLGLDVPACRSW